MEYTLDPMYQLLASFPQMHTSLYLAHSLGYTEATILSVLISKSTWYQNNGYDQEGWFYCTQEDLERSTTFGRKTQQAAIKHLVEEGFLEYQVSGMPAKRYFRLINDPEKLNEFIRIGMEKYNGYSKEKHSKSAINAEKSSMSKRDKQECPKRTNKFDQMGQTRMPKTDEHTSKNNNINNNNKKYNAFSSEDKESDPSDITDSKVIKEIISYLNERAGTAYRPTGSDTQKHISARLSEGFTLEEFIRVIDKKCDEWLNTDMAKYLRPSTLFGTKFESYLNAPEPPKKQFDVSKYEAFINVFPEPTPKEASVEDMLNDILGDGNDG